MSPEIMVGFTILDMTQTAIVGITMELDDTLKDDHLFLIFSVALMVVAKSNQLLMLGGADPEAIRYINKAIELISRQLNETAMRMETEHQAMKDLDELCKKLGIQRADERQEGNDADENSSAE